MDGPGPGAARAVDAHGSGVPPIRKLPKRSGRGVDPVRELAEREGTMLGNPFADVPGAIVDQEDRAGGTLACPRLGPYLLGPRDPIGVDGEALQLPGDMPKQSMPAEPGSCSM